jgi:GAF domain-containing protein
VVGGVLPVDAGRLARDLGAASSISAEVGSRFGVIEAHSGEQDHFTAEDAEFLEGVAGVLGAAGERAGHEDLMRDSEAQFRELADTTPASCG